MPGLDAIVGGIEAAARRRLGSAVRVVEPDLATLGGMSRTLVFTLVDGAGARRRLVSRQVTYTGSERPFLSAAEQFRVMALAFRHGVRVPEPVFEYDATDGLGDGFVMAHVAGETMPRRILADPAFAAARARLGPDAAETMALLHAIPPEEAGFLADRAESRDPLAAQRDRLDHYGEAHPAIEAGLRWLERNRPAAVPARFLHGDFRIGNVMVDAAGLAALLDWECAMLGPPALEIGWIATRSWRFGAVGREVGGFTDLASFLADYRAAGGCDVRAEEVRYWEVWGLVRWAVFNVMQAFGHVEEGRSSVAWAACGRNTALVEYDLLMTLMGRYR